MIDQPKDNMKTLGIPPLNVIGIDPGTSTGWCCYCVLHGVISEVITMTFWEAIKRAKQFDPKWTLFIVEDPAQNKPVWNRRLSKDVNLKVAQDVGGNKREARLLIDGLRNLGFVVSAIRPREGKWTSRYFRGITGYEGRVSEHVRDAARLCYGVRQWPVETREKGKDIIERNMSLDEPQDPRERIDGPHGYATTKERR